MIIHSIIQKSQLEGTSRLDAEYYQPEYLKVMAKLTRYKKLEKLSDCAVIISGPAYSSEEMGEELEIPLARIGDVTGKIGIEDWIRLSQKEFTKFASKRIKNLDILQTMTGDPPDVGKCYFISTNDSKILAFNQRVAKLTAKINPYYLFAYLSTEIGRLQSERNALGIRQRNLAISDLRNTFVAIPSSAEKENVEKLIKDYLQEINNSKLIYQQAEEVLLEELGLKVFQAEEDLSFIVNLSDIKSAKRVDAEYFQPKYQKLVEQIKKHNAKLLGDLVAMKKGFEPGSEAYQEEGKLFIRVSSLSKFGIDDKDQKYLNNELYKHLKKDFEPQVGELLLTKDATPGVAYVLREQIEGIISGGILRLKLKEDIYAEYLALCTNSIVGKWQAERDAGGSVIEHWRPEQIKNIIVPVLPKSTQQKIVELVRKSHEARKKSKDLLEEAKRKVEEMIERGSNGN